jgi:chaperonin cofactor prefoldin
MGQTLGDNMSHIFFTNNPSFKVVKIESKSVREIELENMMELLSKRLRVLESNNENLKSNHQNLNSELARLKDYHSQYE